MAVSRREPRHRGSDASTATSTQDDFTITSVEATAETDAWTETMLPNVGISTTSLIREVEWGCGVEGRSEGGAGWAELDVMVSGTAGAGNINERVFLTERTFVISKPECVSTVCSVSEEEGTGRSSGRHKVKRSTIISKQDEMVRTCR
ncbi:unnamed protein product [Discosporangium mesarthrocarpum]